MNKYVLLGIFIVIFVAGLGVIISNEHIGFDELLRSLSDLNPRVLSLIALPFIAVLFVLGIYLRKRKEARMWKKAVLKTRDKMSKE
jgi:TRAP-type C4-dicarboxylate transport system permease small subunit